MGSCSGSQGDQAKRHKAGPDRKGKTRERLPQKKKEDDDLRSR